LDIDKYLEVLTYDAGNLATALSNEYFSALEFKTLKKYHYNYFLEYFGNPSSQNSYGHNATIIVIEKEYTSKSYLDDYQSHYVLAYKEYPKTCKRVHFFNYDYLNAGLKTFTREDFLNECSNHKNHPVESEFWKSYLGYIVIRPLPKGLIGATVLKGYTNDERRKYTATHPYKINIYGIEKTIDSMVYIEQDSMIGACATSALFSAFHQVSSMFQTPLPFPNKITISAGISFSEPNRIFPNRDGLDILQAANTIDALGLVPEIRSPEFDGWDKEHYNNKWLKSFLYAYCRIGIPIILGIKLENKKQNHAITINGYRDINELEFKNRLKAHKQSLKSEEESFNLKDALQSVKNIFIKSSNENLSDEDYPSESELTLKSFFLERFYAHDDQIGPFSRIGFEGNDTIISAWWEDDINQKLKASLHAIIVPMENIIRIPFELVMTKLAEIDFWLKRKFNTNNFHSDLYLDYSNEYKKRLREDKAFDVRLNDYSLLIPLPKYIWVAEIYFNGVKVFDLIFDSAEINETCFVVQMNFHNSYIKEYLTKTLSEITSENLSKELWQINIQFLNFLRKTCGLSKI
jgi:hypothetical protein